MYQLFIVEDEAKIRKGLRCGYPWEEMGFTVAGDAPNGSEALDYILAHPVDAVLSDIRMPGLSGIDLAKRLQEMKSPVKLILLSGYREFENAQKAVRYGVKDFLLKPAGYDEVLAAFSRIRCEMDEERGTSGCRQDSNDQNCTYYDRIIRSVCAYIDSNLSSCSLDGAAEVSGISPGYVSRLFKQITGINFQQYIMNKKMKRAAELLDCSSRFSIDRISGALGYYSAKNFSKAFREYCGMSPREYRTGKRRDSDEA